MPIHCYTVKATFDVTCSTDAVSSSWIIWINPLSVRLNLASVRRYVGRRGCSLYVCSLPSVPTNPVHTAPRALHTRDTRLPTFIQFQIEEPSTKVILHVQQLTLIWRSKWTPDFARLFQPLFNWTWGLPVAAMEPALEVNWVSFGLWSIGAVCSTSSQEFRPLFSSRGYQTSSGSF